MNSYRDFLAACRRDPPRVALVLGSGLGDCTEGFVADCTVAYSGVPGLEEPSVPGHEGELRLGSWGGQRVLLFVGRMHYYEGHAWRQVEHQGPMARELGAEILLLTNAAGGIHADLCPGSLMLIRDHLEWTRSYSWRFPGPGQRPSPYSTRLQETFSKVSAALDVRLTPGVYAQVTGPCYETPAEIRALNRVAPMPWACQLAGRSTAATLWAWNVWRFPASPIAPLVSPPVQSTMRKCCPPAAPARPPRRATRSISTRRLNEVIFKFFLERPYPALHHPRVEPKRQHAATELDTAPGILSVGRENRPVNTLRTGGPRKRARSPARFADCSSRRECPSTDQGRQAR